MKIKKCGCSLLSNSCFHFEPSSTMNDSSNLSVYFGNALTFLYYSLIKSPLSVINRGFLIRGATFFSYTDFSGFCAELSLVRGSVTVRIRIRDQ